MSSNSIIKVEGLSKHYLLNKSEMPKSDTLYGNFINGLRNIKHIGKKPDSIDFWALKDINFEINQGDRVGIIGRNGAGKSTLLKILSRITPPTKGRIEITGRVASLLEVGTGFHGDLSGRENIYLNGSILGMSKHEIDKKFDEIVAFAEVEDFLDTPVKRYSSGMYVRLAFAVAAHLEPEVLIVDEVLAVGDAAFQKKCLGKMKDVSSSGRTILFVSHQMAAIQNLCDKCLYLKNGEVVDYGFSEKVISKYLLSSQASSSIELQERQDRSGNGWVKFQSIIYKDNTGAIITSAISGSSLNIEFTMLSSASKELSNLNITVGIDDENEQRIAQLNNQNTNQLFDQINPGIFKINIHIPVIPFKSGRYAIALFASVNGEITDWIQDATSLDIESGDFFKTGRLPEEGQGSVYVNHSYNMLG